MDITKQCSLTKDGKKETWLLSGRDVIKEAGDASEVSALSGSTQTNPTFSREDLGAALSANKDKNNSDRKEQMPWNRLEIDSASSAQGSSNDQNNALYVGGTCLQ